MSQTTACFHCGESVPDGPPIYARLGSASQPMCCFGCKAVAEFIQGSGLEAFYQHRLSPDVELGLRVEESDWQIYDDEDLLTRYVHVAEQTAIATVDIGGMYCSACVWLFDNAIGRMDGIDSAVVNSATHRAVIRWDPTQLTFSQLLASISQVGFKPAPAAVGFADSDNDKSQRTALRRLIVAAAAGMQVMMFAVALYAGEHYGIEGRIEHFLRVISLLVCLPIVFYSARPFFAGAYRGLRARSPGMDLPVSLAIAAAFVASTAATLLNRGAVYFDSVAMFVLFLSATRYLEMRARHRSEDFTQALARLLPEVVTRVRDDVPEVISIDKLRAGDVVLIRPGDVIPADGRVLSGKLAIDEALLTGESHPVSRQDAMEVFAGGINRAGNASVEISRVGAGTSLAEIGRLLEQARADRPPVALLADRVASKFVTGMLIVAAVTGLVWLRLDPSRAFEIVLATLVVTCPCALSLATPAALAAAASRLAKDGFLLVRSRILDVIARPVRIVFDKTGTLTAGRPAILEVGLLQSTADEHSCCSIAAELETASEHILARAFADHYSVGRHASDKLQVVAGHGVEGMIDGERYRLGKLAYVAELSGAEGSDKLQTNDHTTVYLGNKNSLIARFSIGDELRDDAEESLRILQLMGRRLTIVSGDRTAAVRSVARKLGVKEWYAGQTPAEKLALLTEFQSNGDKVLMIGDGINDAPVLAAADASIAIDAGTALARASADAIAIGKRLRSIVDAITVASATRRVIRQNIAWAITYNIIAIPLAASGMLAPWMAAIGMSVSSLVVVFNALRLQRLDTTTPITDKLVSRSSADQSIAA